MNNLIVAGNLTRDAEQRAFPDGTPVTHFSVADNSSSAAPTIFWDCRIVGKYALTMTEHLLKGTPVTVWGRAVTEEWTAKDGTPKQKQMIRVDTVTLQGSRGQANSRPPGTLQSAHPQQQKLNSQPYGLREMGDDDIPF